MKSKLFFLVTLLAVMGICNIAFAQEEIILSTYYPAPYGEYEELSVIKADGAGAGVGGPDFFLVTTKVGEPDATDPDRLGTIYFEGRNTTPEPDRQATGAMIRAVAEGTWGIASDLDDAPTRLEFYTQSAGGDNNMTEPRMVIDSGGCVGIVGSPIPLYVAGDAMILSGTGGSVNIQTDIQQDVGTNEAAFALARRGVVQFLLQLHSSNNFVIVDNNTLPTGSLFYPFLVRAADDTVGIGTSPTAWPTGVDEVILEVRGPNPTPTKCQLRVSGPTDSALADGGGGIQFTGGDGALVKSWASIRGLKENDSAASPDNRASYLSFGTRAGVAFSSVAEKVIIDSWGNLGIGVVGSGGASSPTVNTGKVLFFGDNGGDPTMVADTAGIYAREDTGVLQMYAIGEDNIENKISSHNPLTGEWEHYSKNSKTGRVVRIEMEKLVEEVERLSGKQFMFVTYKKVGQTNPNEK